MSNLSLSELEVAHKVVAQLRELGGKVLLERVRERAIQVDEGLIEVLKPDEIDRDLERWGGRAAQLADNARQLARSLDALDLQRKPLALHNHRARLSKELHNSQKFVFDIQVASIKSSTEHIQKLTSLVWPAYIVNTASKHDPDVLFAKAIAVAKLATSQVPVVNLIGTFHDLKEFPKEGDTLDNGLLFVERWLGYLYTVTALEQILKTSNPKSISDIKHICRDIDDLFVYHENKVNEIEVEIVQLTKLVEDTPDEEYFEEKLDRLIEEIKTAGSTSESSSPSSNG